MFEWLDLLAPDYTLTLSYIYIQRYRWITPFTEHHCTRTRTYSLHSPSPSNGSEHTIIITVSLNTHSTWNLHFTDLLLQLTLFFTTHNGTPSPSNGSQHTGIITVSLNHPPHIKPSLHRCTLATHPFLHNSQRQAASYRELTENSCNLPSRTACKRASFSPINHWSDRRETLVPTVLQLLCHCWNAWCHCWRGHVTPPHSCVMKVFIAVA
jgi:hypothetical protein